MPNRSRETIENARKAWPSIDVPDDVFLAYVADRAATSTELHTSDLFLACACASQSSRAVALFERQFLGNLRKLILPLLPSDSLVQDVRQELMQKLFVSGGNGHLKILEYSGKGPLASWVKAVALRTALNLSRKGRHELSDDVEELLEGTSLLDDIDLDLIRARYRGPLKAALTTVFDSLSARDRSVLRLHYLGGITLEQLASMYHVHRSSVVRWVGAARQAILESSQKLLADQLKLGQAELGSLLRLMRSQLEVSLIRLLKSSRGGD